MDLFLIFISILFIFPLFFNFIFELNWKFIILGIVFLLFSWGCCFWSYNSVPAVRVEAHKSNCYNGISFDSVKMIEITYLDYPYTIFKDKQITKIYDIND